MLASAGGSLLSTDIFRERSNSLPGGRDVSGFGYSASNPKRCRIPLPPELASTIINRCDKSQPVRSDSGKVRLTRDSAGDRERSHSWWRPALSSLHSRRSSLQAIVPAVPGTREQSTIRRSISLLSLIIWRSRYLARAASTTLAVSAGQVR
jgi:hypothetical protein